MAKAEATVEELVAMIEGGTLAQGAGLSVNRSTTMPVRQMTQQEVRDWLGSGIVMPVPKQQKASTEPSLAQCCCSAKWLHGAFSF